MTTNRTGDPGIAAGRSKSFCEAFFQTPGDCVNHVHWSC